MNVIEFDVNNFNEIKFFCHLGLVPKANGDLRLIFDLSHGKENSVNGGTDKSLCKTEYKPFEYAVRMVMKAQEILDRQDKHPEQGCYPYMAKSDLKSAFR